MSPKPTYISVHPASEESIFYPGFKTEEQGMPDWFIVDDFFKRKPIIDWINESAEKGRVFWLTAGEECKSLAQVEKLLQWLVENEVKRSESVAVVGGGTVLDSGLFAASIYQRGLRKWSIPTTLLATVDAAIGGKNGVNFMGIKNYVGTITQPDFVLSDFRVFETLNERDVLNGWMEMTKHGLIASAALWNKMKEFKRIPKPSEMHSLIEDASTIKKQLVEADEIEFGLRKTLNFGHTVGHALESVATAQNKGLPHGIAVGLGMMCSLHWSASRAESQDIEGELISAAKCIEQWLLAEVPGTVRAIVEGVDLTTLWSFMKKDKKNDALGVQEILLREIGQATWNEPLSFADFETSWSNALGGS